jgi:hypothetical protein
MSLVHDGRARFARGGRRSARHFQLSPQWQKPFSACSEMSNFCSCSEMSGQEQGVSRLENSRLLDYRRRDTVFYYFLIFFSNVYVLIFIYLNNF